MVAPFQCFARLRPNGHDARKGVIAAWLIVFGCSAAAQSPTPPDPRSETVTVLPPGLRVKQLALGDYHSCALLESGRVACWGNNERGQLGSGSNEKLSFAPMLVPGVFNAVEVQSAGATTCTRTATGDVSCWGDNSLGQANPKFDAALKAEPIPCCYDATLTIGPAGDASSHPPPASWTPQNVLRAATANEAAKGARSLALGYGHACGLFAEGRATCWGDATEGQLGASAPRDAFQVQTIAGLPPLVDVASAASYSCGRTTEGAVWCWGDNGQAQLGSSQPGPGPLEVRAVTGAVALDLGGNRACARLRSGQMMCWGASLDCGEDLALPPALVDTLQDTVQLVRAPGGCFWCTLNGSGELSCNGAPIAKVDFTMASVTTVAAGSEHACAARLDGSVWCWGTNPNGELGRRTPAATDVAPGPVQWPDAVLMATREER